MAPATFLEETALKTHIIHIIDASGSMYSYIDDTIGGYNAYLANLAGDGNEYTITTFLFSSPHYFNQLCLRTPLESAPRLDRDIYQAKGYTALLDATGDAISGFRQDFVLPDEEQVLVVSTTDGHENASTRFSLHAIKELITGLEATGRWKFVYLAQGVDNWQGARDMGYNSNSYVGTQVVDSHTSYGETLSKFSSRNATRGFAGAQGMSLHSVAQEDFADEQLQPQPSDNQP